MLISVQFPLFVYLTVHSPKSKNNMLSRQIHCRNRKIKFTCPILSRLIGNSNTNEEVQNIASSDFKIIDQVLEQGNIIEIQRLVKTSINYFKSSLLNQNRSNSKKPVTIKGSDKGKTFLRIFDILANLDSPVIPTIFEMTHKDGDVARLIGIHRLMKCFQNSCSSTIEKVQLSPTILYETKSAEHRIAYHLAIWLINHSTNQLSNFLKDVTAFESPEKPVNVLLVLNYMLKILKDVDSLGDSHVQPTRSSSVAEPLLLTDPAQSPTVERDSQSLSIRDRLTSSKDVFIPNAIAALYAHYVSYALEACPDEGDALKMTIRQFRIGITL